MAWSQITLAGKKERNKNLLTYLSRKLVRATQKYARKAHPDGTMIVSQLFFSMISKM
jgi:hypothetical protein